MTITRHTPIAVDDSPAGGPSWVSPLVRDSLKRINEPDAFDEAQVQASTEMVVLLHSIRRILMWTAVIIPSVLVAIGVVLIIIGVAAPSPDPALGWR